MIAEPTPLHETRAGRELLEEGIEKGIESLVLPFESVGF